MSSVPINIAKAAVSPSSSVKSAAARAGKSAVSATSRSCSVEPALWRLSRQLSQGRSLSFCRTPKRSEQRQMSRPPRMQSMRESSSTSPTEPMASAKPSATSSRVRAHKSTRSARLASSARSASSLAATWRFQSPWLRWSRWTRAGCSSALKTPLSGMSPTHGAPTMRSSSSRSSHQPMASKTQAMKAW